ncbi:MAG: hypothetical protein ACOC3Z_02515 [Nanoarchaeota archaeon]
MKLNDYLKEYDEKTTSDEYLEEGLRFFKRSAKHYNYADKLEKKAQKKPKHANELKTTAKQYRNLGDEYKALEDAFANKDMDRKVLRDKFKKLKEKEKDIYINKKLKNTDI